MSMMMGYDWVNESRLAGLHDVQKHAVLEISHCIQQPGRFSGTPSKAS